MLFFTPTLVLPRQGGGELTREALAPQWVLFAESPPMGAPPFRVGSWAKAPGYAGGYFTHGACDSAVFLALIIHESAAPTVDMTVLPGVLGCSFDRLRTGSPATYCSSTPRIQTPAVARWTSHLIRARCSPLSPASGFPVSRPHDTDS
jgi:hypothetical protein